MGKEKHDVRRDARQAGLVAPVPSTHAAGGAGEISPTRKQKEKNMTTKIFNALERFIKARSGMDARDYGTDANGRKAYQAEARTIAKQRREALKALAEARAMEPRYDVLIASFPAAFSGRLSWNGERLEYCTGQYRPTEYRQAAGAVLRQYISACKQAAAKERPRTFSYESIGDVIAANQLIGAHFFDRSAMRFFKSRVENGFVKCAFEGEGAECRATRARFVTSEQGPDEVRRYTVREAQPDGSVDTVGEFGQYASLRAAKANFFKGATCA